MPDSTWTERWQLFCTFSTRWDYKLKQSTSVSLAYLLHRFRHRPEHQCLIYVQMLILHLLIFKWLPIFPKTTAHWALFLPFEEGMNEGLKFEVKKTERRLY